MKTIFITSFHPLISRNILQTDILSQLKQQDVRIVLVVPEKKTEFFQKEFGSEKVFVEGVTVPKKSVEDALYLFSVSIVGVENHIVRGWKTEGKYGKYYAAQVIHRLFARSFLMHSILRFLARTLLETPVFHRLFTTYIPDLIFATDTFNREDRALIAEATRKGIPTIGMMRSWDNATTKGVLLAVPNRVIVTNEVLKEEMISIHHVTSESITVTGVPHYDVAIRKPERSREAFFKEMGLDPTRKTILFAPGGKILYEHDRELLALFKRHIDTGKYTHDVQFLVRLPPGDTVDISSIEGDAHFIVDEPGTDITGRKKETELSPEDNLRLIHSLAYCDVLVTLVSTMVIDGMVFGKPAVVVGFEPESGLPDSVKKFATYKHFEKMLRTNLVTFCTTEDAFIREVNAYLDMPSRHARERSLLLDRYAYKLDGNSGKRVAECVLRELGF